MKKMTFFLILSLFFLLSTPAISLGQCSICTKTAQQLGEGPGRGLNAGILYLAAAPLMILGFIGYKWYNSNKS
jgi:hypothetical protein